MNEETLINRIQKSGTRVSLTGEEHGAARRALVRAMQESTRKPVRSPFSYFMMPAFSALAIVFLIGGGVGTAFAAERALPGDPLYVLKLKVNDPIRLALVTDTKQKALLEVDLADKRLKEYAVVALDESVDTRTAALIAAAVSEHIEGAQVGIDQLSQEGSVEEALGTNSELMAVLETHAAVLDTVTEQNPETAKQVDSLSSSLDTKIEETEAATESMLNAVEEPQNAVADAKQGVIDAQAEVRAQVEEGAAQIDTDDQEAITATLESIDEALQEAEVKQVQGDAAGALELYAEADGELTKLNALLEAEQELGVDVVHTSAEE